MRIVDVHTPSEYQGYLGHDQNSWKFTYELRHFFINGVISIDDGTFLSGFFISDIENVNIVVGPYPLYACDIEEIASTGANAVINLQLPEEITARQADTKMLEQAYRSRGINTFFHIPVDDENAGAYQK